MSEDEALEERLLRVIHEPDAEVELLVHEVAASEDAQTYLMSVIATLSALAPDNHAASRAAALLQQAMAIAGERALEIEDEVAARAARRAIARGSDDGSDR